DYAIAKAALLPTFELDSIETPSPVNALGAKGCGESGTIGSTPAIVNAVIDALAPFGVTHLDMPLTPASIWAAVEHARGRRPRMGRRARWSWPETLDVGTRPRGRHRRRELGPLPRGCRLARERAPLCGAIDDGMLRGQRAISAWRLAGM